MILVDFSPAPSQARTCGMKQEIRPCRSRPTLILEGAIEANRKERKEHKDEGIWLIFLGKR